MGSDLVRFSIAMPEDLLCEFDHYVAKRGISVNRSEAIRDLVRDALVEEERDSPGQEIAGTLTLVYNHHANNLTERLDALQHEYFDSIISTMHIHLDADNCLEIIAMRGEYDRVKMIAEALLGLKGVKHGKLTTTTTGKFI